MDEGFKYRLTGIIVTLLFIIMNFVIIFTLPRSRFFVFLVSAVVFYLTISTLVLLRINVVKKKYEKHIKKTNKIMKTLLIFVIGIPAVAIISQFFYNVNNIVIYSFIASFLLIITSRTFLYIDLYSAFSKSDIKINKNSLSVREEKELFFFILILFFIGIFFLLLTKYLL